MRGVYLQTVAGWPITLLKKVREISMCKPTPLDREASGGFLLKEAEFLGGRKMGWNFSIVLFIYMANEERREKTKKMIWKLYKGEKHAWDEYIRKKKVNKKGRVFLQSHKKKHSKKYKK